MQKIDWLYGGPTIEGWHFIIIKRFILVRILFLGLLHKNKVVLRYIHADRQLRWRVKKAIYHCHVSPPPFHF